MITYPDKPWNDGQTLKYTTPEGEEVVGIYNKSKNAWTFTRLQESGAGGGGIVTTDDVKTLNTRPDNVRNPFELTDDPNTTINQQEANWYLWESVLSNKEDIESIDSEVQEKYVTKEYFLEDQQRQDDVIAGLSGDNSSLVQRVDAGEVTQAQIQETIDTALTIQSGIQTEQGVQNNQINAIETQIQLLAQTQAAGKWTYERNISGSVRPPNARRFYGTHTDDVATVLTDWSDLRLIMVDKTDLDGNVYTFSAFEEGDKIEILATDGSSACFGTVTNNPQQETYGNMLVTVERSNGGPTEGKEYILSVYRPGANGGDVDLDTLDGRYVVKLGDTITGELIVAPDRGSAPSVELKPAPDAPDERAVIYTRDKNQQISFFVTKGGSTRAGRKIDEPFIATEDWDLTTKKYVDDAVQNSFENLDFTGEYLRLDGGVLTGNLVLDTGSGLYSKEIIKSTRDTGYALQVKPGDIGDATAYIHTNGNAEFAHVKVRDTPTNNSDLTTKEYVDSAVESLPTIEYVDNAVANAGSGGGVPVGSIMIWMNPSAPAGWFKLQGSSFNINTYPQLHAYLQNTSGYTSGKLPNWGGHYPGEYGDHLALDLGSKQGYRTGKPSAGAPRSSASIPNGNTRTFNGSGGTNAYSDGADKVSINENWDSTTRPKTVVVHYIIKHD